MQRVKGNLEEVDVFKSMALGRIQAGKAGLCDYKVTVCHSWKTVVLGKVCDSRKRSISEKGEGDLENYGLVQLFLVTGEVTEGIHRSLFPNM